MFYFCVGRDSKGLSQLSPQTQEAMQVRMYRLLASLIPSLIPVSFPVSFQSHSQSHSQPHSHAPAQSRQSPFCTTQLGVNTSVMHPAATQHVPSTGLRPKLSVSFLRCRISRLKLLEYQYYSTLDKMAALEPLTLQHLTVSTSASFPYHPALVSFSYHLVCCHKHSAYIPVIVIPPPSSHTHSTHPSPFTKAFVTRLKKQLFVESLVQGNVTIQVRLSTCDVCVCGEGGEEKGEEEKGVVSSPDFTSGTYITCSMSDPYWGWFWVDLGRG